MCGIGGELYINHHRKDGYVLNRMSEAMKERGPDDEGIYSDETIGLVHRRLSIIDLSPAGRCPMDNEDGSVKIVFNGEIYNYQGLRQRLLDMGHNFRSDSDTEVILHGYEQWGEDIVSQLNGMFAFAIWDSEKKCLFIARDRLGEKPLYYAELPGRFVFASTIIALTAGLKDHFSLNYNAMNSFLSCNFIPGPQTIWNEVSSLLPGHTMTVTQTGKISVRQYWDFPDSPIKEMNDTDAEEYIEHLLENSVKHRLIADVPVGGFLSGGVDSSLIMTLASRHSSGINTFSIGFLESDFSELRYAQQVAKVIGSTHNELMLSENNVLSIIPMLVWHYGQPYGDSSCIPTYLVSELSRKTVKVGLTGDGGDESFAGYSRAITNWYASIYRDIIPERLRHNIIPALCYSLKDSQLSGFFKRLNSLNQLSMMKNAPIYTNSLSWLNNLNELQGPVLKNYKTDVNSFSQSRTWNNDKESFLIQVLYDDFKVQLPDDFLVKVDIASMAASLEVRSPFLDHEFAEAAWALPDKMKLRFGQRKWLLKRIAAKYIPKSVIYRKKMGFVLPMKHWWKGKLSKALSVLMTDSRAVQWGWIELSPVMKAISEHKDGKEDHSTRLWQILCLELWARIVVEESMTGLCSLVDLI